MTIERRPVRAIVSHYDDATSCLQIELENNCGITLTYPDADDSDEPPTLSLWVGNGQASLEDYSRTRWREWLDMALDNTRR